MIRASRENRGVVPVNANGSVSVLQLLRYDPKARPLTVPVDEGNDSGATGRGPTRIIKQQRLARAAHAVAHSVAHAVAHAVAPAMAHSVAGYRTALVVADLTHHATFPTTSAAVPLDASSSCDRKATLGI